MNRKLVYMRVFRREKERGEKEENGVVLATCAGQKGDCDILKEWFNLSGRRGSLYTCHLLKREKERRRKY